MAGSFRRLWSERRGHCGLGSWLVSIYDRVLRGLPRAPLPFRGRAVPVRLRALGRKFLVRMGTSDLLMLRETVLLGEYGEAIRAFPGTGLILDLGANVGVTLRFWREHFPAARIVGVEPDRSSARICRWNARGGIRLVRAAVGARARVATMQRAALPCCYRLGRDLPAGAVPQEGDVRVLTVPQILEQAGERGAIDLLKCDIEGGERELFDECAPWIGRVRLLTAELHDELTSEWLLERCRSAGGAFEVLADQVKEPGIRLVTLRGVADGPGP
jgi:FkbM family methyltransferase